MPKQATPNDPGRAGPGAILLLVPLLSFVLAGTWLWVRAWPRLGARPAPPNAAQAEFEILAGEAQFAGLRLAVRLEPLGADPARRAFETQALARRFGLGEGEAWRLVLELFADGSAPTVPPAELALEGIGVRHDGGWIAPLVPAAPIPAPGAVVDPLRTLLAPPTALVAGRELALVLWGPAPIGAASVARGSEALVTLVAQRSRASERSLARVEEREEER